MKVATLKDVTANAGEQVELYLEISGSPAPAVEWTKGTTKVSESDRIQIVSTPNDATLVIMKCARGDTSEYTVSISNKHGSEKASVKVKIIGEYRLENDNDKYLYFFFRLKVGSFYDSLTLLSPCWRSTVVHAYFTCAGSAGYVFTLHNA